MRLVRVRARLPVEGKGPGCRNVDLTVLPGESLLPQGWVAARTVFAVCPRAQSGDHAVPIAFRPG